MAEEYYKPSEIIYSEAQIKWLIPYLPMLRSGDYPVNHRETGYIDKPAGKRQIRSKARFVTAGEIAAELDFRLQQAGWEGLILEMVYSTNPDDKYSTMQHIAVALGVEIEEMDWRIQRVLKYVRGFKRKSRSFKNWKDHKRRDYHVET